MSWRHCLLAYWLMTAAPQWLANKDWFSVRVRFVCWCVGMLAFVCFFFFFGICFFFRFSARVLLLLLLCLLLLLSLLLLLLLL